MKQNKKSETGLLTRLICPAFLAFSLLLSGCQTSDSDAAEEITESSAAEDDSSSSLTESSSSEPSGSENGADSSDLQSTASEDLNVYVLDVGQGLSVFMESEGKTLLYDGGGPSSSSYVVSWLKQQDISKIDILIASHYDSDHLSGLVGVLNAFQTGTVYGPDYSCETRVCRSFFDEADSDGEIIHPERGTVLSLGAAQIEFLAPENHAYDSNNDYSEVIQVSVGESSLLITGDAEKTSENEMVQTYGDQLKSDVYIVGHHGSSTSSSVPFLDLVSPEYAIISCGLNNEYGHPHMETMENLKSRNVIIYRTDEQGMIHFVMTPADIRFDLSPAPEPYKSGSSLADYGDQTEPDESENSSSSSKTVQDTGSVESTGETWVLNTRSKKIHHPDCSAVQKMSEQNKEYSSASLSDLEAEGYTPCRLCFE